MSFKSIKTKATGGKDFDPVPAGTHFAFCTQLIDLGTQLTTYEGKERTRAEIYIRFEVPEERLSYVKDGKEVTGPMTIGATFTNSIGEKSKLRPMLESWRGKPFTPEELDGFELTSIVGKPCQISVTHKPKPSGGGVYANITAILGVNKLQKAAQAEGKLPKAPETDVVVYTPSEHDQGDWEKLPKWIQEKIEARVVDTAEDVPVTQVGKVANEDFDDDIPF